MGIKGLSKLLADEAPDCVKETAMKNYFGRAVAIDASMAIYQFLVAVRSQGGGGGGSYGGGAYGQLTNDAGEVTSHLIGFFYRTIRLMTNGLKPVWVFDGKPPTLKSGELAKRKAVKAKAQADLKEAEAKAEAGEEGAAADVERFAKRTVSMTKQNQEDVKKLLRLMGCPVVEAPCEAEASCAALARGGKVWATATEDMDALTFATPFLLRRLTFSEARKLPVMEFNYQKAVQGLGLSHDQFVDLCILCGCDYTDSIRGVGPKTALKLIREHGSLEKIIPVCEAHAKWQVPDSLKENYAEARRLFKQADVVDPAATSLKWTAPDEAGLVQYLAVEKGFSEDRVRSGIAKMKKAKGKQAQRRMDSFFKVVAAPSGANKKRKQAPKGKKGKKGKGKGGGFGFGKKKFKR